MTREIEATIDKLSKLSLDELRTEWVRRHKRPAPPCRSRDLLRGLLAWPIQEKAYGGFRPETKRQLKTIGMARGGGDSSRSSHRLMPGSVLVREWHGVSHRVYVQESGFSYEGKSFDDLSTIARVITGTRWSGPRFFGLNKDGKEP
jgi:hypothetical protein